MHYDKIMGDFGYFHAESRKLWSSTCFLTPIIAGSVVNDQKTESFLHGNINYVLYYFPKERPGALIRIRLGLGESAKT
jgi:hypothetical protein